jgi:hypothetical protein
MVRRAYLGALALLLTAAVGDTMLGSTPDLPRTRGRIWPRSGRSLTGAPRSSWAISKARQHRQPISVILHVTLSAAGAFEHARIYPIHFTGQGQPLPGGSAISFGSQLSA